MGVTEREMHATGNVPTSEVGKTGLQQWNGMVSETYTSKLNWPMAYGIYDEMRRRDPTIRTLWNALILLARTASWYAEPGGTADADRRAAGDLNEFVHGMNHTLEDAIEDALSCVLFGWSWLETVYKRRSDGMIAWRKWAMRRQGSFDHWDLDEAGGVRAMVQRPAPDYRDIPIPIERSLHFTSQRDGGNPEGLALLESLYEIWYFLKNYQIIQGIGWQRSFVGLPVFRCLEVPSDDDKAIIERVGQALTVDEKQYVLVPKSVEFALESARNEGAEALLKTIQYYRLLILQTLLADFINLGVGQTGSWALGSDKSQLFLMAVDGYLDRVATVINRFGIPRLFAYNGYTGALPKLVHTRVEKRALSQLGSWLQIVAGILNLGPEDEKWIREQSGMPTRASGLVTPSPAAPAGLAEFGEFDGQAEVRAKIEAAMAREVTRFLADQEERVRALAEAGQNPGDDPDFWAAEEEALREALEMVVLQYANELADVAISEVQGALGGAGADWALVNADAAGWARRHVGKLIKGVTSTTRQAVRESVATWIEAGGDLKALSTALEKLFDQKRAGLIASTEVTRAYAEANRMVWDRLNEQGFDIVPIWTTAEDERVCPVCGPLDGKPATERMPPAHPGCRCWTIPQVAVGE